MADPEIEHRVAALEEQVGRLSHLPSEVRAARDDARAARHLAAANDRDVADLHRELRGFRKTTIQSFNAMREDLVDLRGELHGVRDDLQAQINGVRDDLQAQINDLRDETRAGHQVLVGMLTTLIERDET